jgi:hypothetical protein
VEAGAGAVGCGDGNPFRYHPQFVGEIVLQAVFELLAEAGFHGLAAPFHRARNPVRATVGFALWGAAAGVVSLWLFPYSPLRNPLFRQINLFVTPVAPAGLMTLVGRIRLGMGQDLVRLDRFAWAFPFAFAMALVRFISAAGCSTSAPGEMPVDLPEKTIAFFGAGDEAGIVPLVLEDERLAAETVHRVIYPSLADHPGPMSVDVGPHRLEIGRLELEREVLTGLKQRQGHRCRLAGGLSAFHPFGLPVAGTRQMRASPALHE